MPCTWARVGTTTTWTPVLLRRPGRGLGDAERVGVVGQHDHLGGAGRLDRVEQLAGARAAARERSDTTCAPASSNSSREARAGHHGDEPAAHAGAAPPAAAGVGTCSAKWVTRIRRGRPASMPASIAAPTSSTCTCTFHSPVAADHDERVAEPGELGRAGPATAASSASSRYITSYAGPPSVRSPVRMPRDRAAAACRAGACGAAGAPPVIADSTARRGSRTAPARRRRPRPPRRAAPAGRGCGPAPRRPPRPRRARPARGAPTRRSAASAAASAAARATLRMVPSTGRPTAAQAASAAWPMPSAKTAAERSPGPACPIRRSSAPTSWLRITPELPRAPSSAPRASAGASGAAGRAPAARRPVAQRARAASTVRYMLVPVSPSGDRVDVERVDLLARRAEPLDGEVREPAYGVEVEGGNLGPSLHPTYSCVADRWIGRSRAEGITIGAPRPIRVRPPG